MNDEDFGDCSLLALFVCAKGIVDARADTSSALHAAVPREFTPHTGTFCHQFSCSVHYLHVRTVHQSCDMHLPQIVGTDRIGKHLQIAGVHGGGRVGGITVIRAKPLAGGDEDFSRLTADGDVVDFVADERTVLSREVFDGFHAIGTQQIDPVFERANPLAVTSVNSDALHRNATEQVVAQPRTIVSRHDGLREGKIALEHLLWSLGHEEPLRAAHPHRPVQVFGRIVIEVGRVTLPILILEGGDVSVLVVRLLVDGAVGVDDEQSGLTVVRRASRVDPCPSAPVKVGVIPSGLCRSLRIIVRDPSPIPLQSCCR